jgi:hypothetical protein
MLGACIRYNECGKSEASVHSAKLSNALNRGPKLLCRIVRFDRADIERPHALHDLTAEARHLRLKKCVCNAADRDEDDIVETPMRQGLTQAPFLRTVGRRAAAS